MHIEITMDTERLDEDEVAQEIAGNVLCKVKPDDIPEEVEEVFAKVEQEYGETLRGHIRDEDLNKAHQTWNVLVEVFVNMVHGKMQIESIRSVGN